jgi:hypothetical protein
VDLDVGAAYRGESRANLVQVSLDGFLEVVGNGGGHDDRPSGHCRPPLAPTGCQEDSDVGWVVLSQIRPVAGRRQLKERGMRYELRTTVTFASGNPRNKREVGRADRVLQWLYEYLPTKATMGCDLAAPRWVGNRYTESDVMLQVMTEYRDVFAATADRLRIEQALAVDPPPSVSDIRLNVSFEVFRLYRGPELVDTADSTKKITHPTKISHPTG